MPPEEVNKYLINKGDIDGVLTVKLIGNIIHHGYFYIEDQNEYSMQQNSWRFAVWNESAIWVNGENIISIDYQIS